MKRSNYIFIAVLLLGFLVRVVDLVNHPAGFTPDEASFGYDAYSLIKTGRDQWGNSWPLTLKSFGDYKMPLYTYLTIPSVLLFGLNEVSVRLPNAVLGTLSILATYLLTKHVFDKKVALFSALLVAISPWHVPLSRGAFEANLTTFFLPLAAYFFLRGKNPLYISTSAILFGLNLFTYHSARLITPFIILALVVTELKNIKSNLKIYKPGILIFSIFAMVGLYTLGQGSAIRATTSSVFSTSSNILHDRVEVVTAGEPVLISKLFNNRATYLADKISGNYLSYFSPEFLFTSGAREGTYGMVPGEGVLYLFEIISCAMAFVYVISKKLKFPLWLIVWILISPIPAALSIGPGMAANRAAIMMPAVQIVSGYGLYLIYKKYPQIVTALIATSFLFFMENYWFWQPAKQAKAMIYGAREVVTEVEKISDQYSQIILTKELSEPHIFVAFYGRVDPFEFQSASRNWNFEERDLNWVDQLPRYSLGKYTFKTIDWSADIELPRTLIITTPENIPTGLNVVHTIYYPNGKEAYVMVDNVLTNFAWE